MKRPLYLKKLSLDYKNFWSKPYIFISFGSRLQTFDWLLKSEWLLSRRTLTTFWNKERYILKICKNERKGEMNFTYNLCITFSAPTLSYIWKMTSPWSRKNCYKLIDLPKTRDGHSCWPYQLSQTNLYDTSQQHHSLVIINQGWLTNSAKYHLKITISLSVPCSNHYWYENSGLCYFRSQPLEDHLQITKIYKSLYSLSIFTKVGVDHISTRHFH